MIEERAIGLTMRTGNGPLTGRLTLPLRVEVDGVEAVLVSAEAYDALFQAANKSAGSRSRIERDPEVERFVDERLSALDLPSLLSAIVRQFGQDRAPSLSGLHRYAMRRRQAAAAVTKPTLSRRGSQGPR